MATKASERPRSMQEWSEGDQSVTDLVPSTLQSLGLPMTSIRRVTKRLGARRLDTHIWAILSYS